MLIARRGRRGHDARGIAVDIADDQIELRHDTTQLSRMRQCSPLSKALGDGRAHLRRRAHGRDSRRLQRLEFRGRRPLAAGDNGAACPMRLPGGAATPAM